MLAPETDPYAAVLRFAIPRRERLGWAGGAVLSLAACVALAFVWPAQTGARLPVNALAVLASILLLARALRADRIEVDVAARKYRAVMGVPRFRKQQAAGLDGSVRLLYRVAERASSATGLPERVYTAWLQCAKQRLPLVEGWNEAAAPEYFALVSERLGVTCAPDDVSVRAGRRLDPGAALMWSGVTVLLAVMFWPVVSGRTPIRVAFASGGSEPQSAFQRDRGAFMQGLSMYREGSFEQAEKQFRQAIDHGYPAADGYNMVAYALAGQGKLSDALDTAKRALSLAPDSGNILDTVGEMHELRKEYAEAVDYYQRALPRIVDDLPVETHAKLGRSFLSLGRFKEGIAHLQEAARFPRHRYGDVAVQLLQGLGIEVLEPLPPRRDRTSISPGMGFGPRP